MKLKFNENHFYLYSNIAIKIALLNNNKNIEEFIKSYQKYLILMFQEWKFSDIKYIDDQTIMKFHEKYKNIEVEIEKIEIEEEA